MFCVVIWSSGSDRTTAMIYGSLRAREAGSGGYLSKFGASVIAMESRTMYYCVSWAALSWACVRCVRQFRPLVPKTP